MDFLKRFVVVLVPMGFVAGLVLVMVGTLASFTIGSYLLYTGLPFLLGLFVTYAVLPPDPGKLAFSLVAAGLFIFLAFLNRTAPAAVVLLSVISAGCGALIWIFKRD
jgi:hypothetical protein